MCINTCISFAWNTATYNITYSYYFGSFFPSKFYSSEGIGCFTALAYCYYKIALFYNMISITKCRAAAAPALLLPRRSQAQDTIPEIAKDPFEGAESLKQYRIP